MEDVGKIRVEARAPQRRRVQQLDRFQGLEELCVAPGNEIRVEPGFVRGHGTLVEDGTLVASVAGIVERVNKLVAVRPLVARYTPEVGDVVVGRVVEVAQKRWRIDIDARQDAVLMLSAVNLPGGVQRRRTYEDELNMRAFIGEDDLISAEVQEIKQDGGVALHTRSLKYGTLSSGQLVCVESALVKRQKKHFHTLPCGIHAIFGNNGFIWLSEGEPRSEVHDEDMSHVKPTKRMTMEEKEKKTTLEGRRRICRVRNAICVLNEVFVSIHSQTIMDVYEASEKNLISLSDMLRLEVRDRITEVARSRKDF